MFDYKNIDVQLNSICERLSSFEFLTHSKIKSYLFQCSIEDLGKDSESVIKNGIVVGYIQGDSKKNRMFKSLANNINKTNTTECITAFLERVFDLSQFAGKKDCFNDAREKINEILLLIGLEVNASGKIIEVKKATTLDEVEGRINKLKSDLYNRKIHSQVLNYCSREYLNKDYFHACFEASKGVFQRIRDLTNRKTDGERLINEVFNMDKLLLVFNKLSNETEKNEFIGVKYLILALKNIVRNPNAHSPRILKETELEECLEVFVIISRIHNYLDISTTTCFV